MVIFTFEKAVYFLCFYFCWMFCLGSIALQNEFSEGDLPILISSLVCSGLEQDLFNCSVNIGSSVSCGRFEDAAIVCQS